MRKVLLILLSLVLALVGWSTVGADDGFYVIPAMKSNYAPVPKTGQTTSYGTRDDGALEKGVAWPTPRFTDNGNGTVTDNLTKLIWMKQASLLGPKTFAQAIDAANGLASGSAGLTDGSQAGDWRLPNVKELLSLVDYSRLGPSLPALHPFNGVQQTSSWSSTAHPIYPTLLTWTVNFYDGTVAADAKSNNTYVWCVRGGP